MFGQIMRALLRRGSSQPTKSASSTLEEALDTLTEQLQSQGFLQSTMPLKEYALERRMKALGGEDPISIAAALLMEEDTSQLKGTLVFRPDASGMDLIAVTFPNEGRTLDNTKIGLLRYGSSPVPFVGEVSLKDYIESARSAAFITSVIGQFGKRSATISSDAQGQKFTI